MQSEPQIVRDLRSHAMVASKIHPYLAESPDALKSQPISRRQPVHRRWSEVFRQRWNIASSFKRRWGRPPTAEHRQFRASPGRGASAPTPTRLTLRGIIPEKDVLSLK